MFFHFLVFILLVNQPDVPLKIKVIKDEKNAQNFKKAHLWDDQADVTLRSEQHAFFPLVLLYSSLYFFFSVSPGPGKC